MSVNHRLDRWPSHQDEAEDPDSHDDRAWLEKWAPPCPDSTPVRLCEILGLRLKGSDYLHLRIVLRPFEWCQGMDCPCNVWLDAPLDERIVIDVDSGEPLPLLIPGWGTDEPSRYVPRPSGRLSPPRPKGAGG